MTEEQIPLQIEISPIKSSGLRRRFLYLISIQAGCLSYATLRPLTVINILSGSDPYTLSIFFLSEIWIFLHNQCSHSNI